MGPPAGLSGSEPPHAHHHPRLPLHELQLQCIRQHPQDHDGETLSTGDASTPTLTLHICLVPLCVCLIKLQVYIGASCTV